MKNMITIIALVAAVQFSFAQGTKLAPAKADGYKKMHSTNNTANLASVKGHGPNGMQKVSAKPVVKAQPQTATSSSATTKPATAPAQTAPAAKVDNQQRIANMNAHIADVKAKDAQASKSNTAATTPVAKSNVAAPKKPVGLSKKPQSSLKPNSK